MDIIDEIKDKYGNTVFRIFTSVAECRERQFRMHRHTQFEIALIENGAGIYDTEHGSENISAGNIFLFSANEYHCVTDIFPCDGNNFMTLLNIQFLPNFAANDDIPGENSHLDVFLSRSRSFRNKLDSNNRFIEKIRDYILLLRSECSEKLPCYKAAVRTVLTELLICLYRNFGLTDQNRCHTDLHHLGNITKAVAYINEHYCENISLRDIMDAAQLSKSTFFTAFRNAFDMTPWNYINIKRTEKAMKLLKESDATVLETAALCGYNGTAGFNRIFKKITGITPREFRAGNR